MIKRMGCNNVTIYQKALCTATLLYIKQREKKTPKKVAIHQVHANRKDLGLVVQRVVNLTRSLRVISLTVLADSIYNILKFFAEKI